MTQTIYAAPSEYMDSRPRLELVAEPDDFEQEFKDMLDFVQDAGEALGRCKEVTDAEQDARKYAAKNWPHGGVINISLPEGTRAYDHNGFQMERCPEDFMCNFFAGFDIGKARFIDLVTSRSVIIPDIRQAILCLADTPEHEGANYE